MPKDKSFELCTQLPDGTYSDAGIHAELLDDPELLEMVKRKSRKKDGRSRPLED